MPIRVLAFLCLLGALFPRAVHAGWNTETLTGDWAGARTRLSEQGITLEVVLKADLLSNRGGGVQRGTKSMDNWDFKLKADAAKLWGWPDTTAYLQVISNHGGRFNRDHVGSFMGVDNIEVDTPTTKIFHAWLERQFSDGTISLLAGLYPIDSEFYVTESSGVFLHPTGGMAAELAQTGVNGPSIFPTSAFGLRFRWQPTPKLNLQAALVDGVPGNPRNPRGTHVRFERGDGTLAIVEVALRPAEADVEPLLPERGVPQEPAVIAHEKYEPISKYAFGYWRYTPRFDDLVDTTGAGHPLRRANRGAYLLAEQSVVREQDDPSQGLALFLRYGVASGDVNTLDRSFSLGIRYRGLVPGRDEDEFGIALARGRASAKFRQAAAVPLTSAETALEITYRARITPWLALQPTLLQVAHPAFGPGPRKARVAGARVEIAF